jgi:two-component system response regulator AtoC
MKDILIIEDDPLNRELFKHICSDLELNCTALADGQEALNLLEQETFRIVITDVKLPGIEGPEILKRVKDSSPETDVIVVTAFGGIEQAVACMKSGAYDYITKPCHPEKLAMTIRRLLERQRLIAETKHLRSKLQREYSFGNIIGRSKVMLEVFDLIRIAAGSDSTVLITGESGTGKELVANCIHYNSTRKKKPFIKVNCPAIPDGLVESELFGHEKGAFTSAVAKRIGKFEEAQNGTIFLDEIAELPLHAQTKLLQVLEDHSIERVGSNKPIKTNVRILAATNRTLDENFSKHDFREDLYWRLNVLRIHVPPLRERKEDTLPIIEHYLSNKYESQKTASSLITPKALKMLLEYDWPGNVRELLNTLEQAALLSRGQVIKPHHLPNKIRLQSQEISQSSEKNATLEAAVKKEIHRALEKHKWNKTRAARELGIDRTSLIRKIKKLGLDETQLPLRE